MTKRSEKDTIEDKWNFATFALDKMKWCTSHRKGKGKDKGKETVKSAEKSGAC